MGKRDIKKADKIEVNNEWNLSDVKIGIFLVLALTLFISSVRININGFVLLFVFDMILILIMLAFLIRNKGNWLQLLGLRKFDKKFLIEGAGLLLVCYIMIFVFKIFLKLVDNEIPYIDPKYLYDAGPSIGYIIYDFAMKTPFVEEIFFRGFIFSGLSSHYGWKKAAALSSLVFALGHISPHNIYSFFPSFIFGFAFCYLYRISKSILPGIIMHVIHNFFVIAITYKQFMSS
jgi:membrane protease YdiL (CAAX protease family)